VAKSKRRRKRSRGTRGGDSRGARPPEELEFERLAAQIKRRAQEAHSPDTPASRVAEVLAADFEDMPAPVGFTETLRQQGSDERVRAVASELRRLAPGSVTALTFEAELARLLDRDGKRAAALLEQALETRIDPAGVADLGEHMLEAGQLVDAFWLASEQLVEDPEDDHSQAVLADAVGALYARARSGENLSREERKALEQFHDRGLLYRLREALGAYVEQRVDLRQLLAEEVRAWQEELPDDVTLLEPAQEGLLGLAIEHAWLIDAEDDEEEELDEPESPLELLAREQESSSPLGHFARDAGTPRELAAAARAWRETCSYGLWQVADPEPSPGVWLTDLVSGARRYVAIPLEQIEDAAPWTVLIAALVSLDGIWRTTGTVIPLRPSEGDAAAEFARETTIAVVEELTGEQARPTRRGQRIAAPEPHGVLVERLEPTPLPVALVMSKIVGSLIPEIAAGIYRRRTAGIQMTNTDGHRIRLITATVAVRGGSAAAAPRLAAHDDIGLEDDGELSWWGRELTKLERESSLAHVRAELGADGARQGSESDEPPRWLRGHLRPVESGFEVEVNSEERLAVLLALLAELGLEPEVGRRTVIDPSEDLPPLPAVATLGFGRSEDQVEAWISGWPDEPTPALGGLTPRAAAKRRKQRVRLEALLRELEHDAHLAARRGEPAPDLARLRAELRIERWWEE
jgi:hypothetical protein